MLRNRKNSVRPMIDFGLDFIRRLKPAKWRYQAPLNDGRDHFGFIAQDVDKIASKEDFNFVTVREGYYAINYYEFIGPIVKAVQELADKVEKLEYEIEKIQKAKGRNQPQDSIGCKGQKKQRRYTRRGNARTAGRFQKRGR